MYTTSSIDYRCTTNGDSSASTTSKTENNVDNDNLEQYDIQYKLPGTPQAVKRQYNNTALTKKRHQQHNK